MLTVMVVDDDPLLCTAMRRKIEMIDRENQLGIQETLIAHSAQEAWGILQEKSVDILISDIRMPYQTGLELADKVNEAITENKKKNSDKSVRITLAERLRVLAEG